MSGPSIFISHSAHESEALEALNTLVQGLKDAKFEVLLDRDRLRVGYSWRPTLRKWMDVCHAAVVVFSPEAITSPNVQHEVDVLMHRRFRTDDRFPVLPF